MSKKATDTPPWTGSALERIRGLQANQSKNGCPVALAVLRPPGSRDSDMQSWVIPTCPLCGGMHWHGAGTIAQDARGFLGHRVAHCAGGGGEGYVLVEFTEDMLTAAKAPYRVSNLEKEIN